MFHSYFYNQFPFNYHTPYQHPNYYPSQQQPVMYHPNFPFIQPKKLDKKITPSPKPVEFEKEETIPRYLQPIMEKLKEMEEENKKLKEEIKNIKPITIENINYKIQDLSVEELSGTLLVGLSALSDAEELKKLLSDNGQVVLNDIDTEEMEEAIVESEEQNDENS